MPRAAYLASPFFSGPELDAVREAEQILGEKGIQVYSPRLHEVRGEEPGTPEWSRKTFLEDKAAIDRCDVVVMLYWGGYSDTGTAWECGYAHGAGKPVIVVHLGEDSNIMVSEGCHSNLAGLESLKDYDFTRLEQIGYKGRVF